MKRVWISIAIILLVGGVMFEEKHRAQTAKKPILPAVVIKQDPALDPYTMEASNFSDEVDLWGNPWMKINDLDLTYASLAFKNGLKPASIEKFQPPSIDETEPVLTVADRQLAYSLFEYGSLKLKLNFKPDYPNPEALLPTRVDPSISGSFSF